MSDQFDPNLLRMILAGAGVVVVLAIYLWSRGRKSARGSSQFHEELPPGALEDLEGLSREIVEPDDETLAREAAALGTEMTNHYEGSHPEPESMPGGRHGDAGFEPATEEYAYSPPAPREEAPPPPRPAPEAEPPRRLEPIVDEEAEDEEEEEYQGEEKIIALHITAPKELVFTGSGVLRVVEECRMEYGELEIFHRRAEKGRRPVFSLANMVKPGVFDPDEMEEFTTPGVTLFLRLPNPLGGIAAFDEMYDAAKTMAAVLHGEVRDQGRNLMTRQIAEHIREQIREFTRKQRLAQVGSSFSGRK